MRTKCSICGSTEFRPTSLTNVMNSGANYIYCKQCGVGCYDREVCTPTEAYDNEASHVLADNCAIYGAMNNLDATQTERYKAAHKSLYTNMLNQIKELRQGNLTSVYEVGSNIGEFLQIARDDFGCQVAGCEPNKRGCEIAGEQGIPLEYAFFQDAHVPDKYDAVIMLDVIEHTSTPVEDLAKAASILKPGGVLLLKTFYEEYHFDKQITADKLSRPDAYSLPIQNRGYFSPRQHLFHFPKALLVKVVEDAGFLVKHTTDSIQYGQLTIYGVKA